MRFIVPVVDVRRFAMTLCVLCSEDPRWCPPASLDPIRHP